MAADTEYGKVQGRKEGRFIAFKGIPFAKPPIGNLRFKPPKEPEPWSDVLQANKFGARSLQTKEQNYRDNIPFSEDCLNLNIWTPGVDRAKDL